MKILKSLQVFIFVLGLYDIFMLVVHFDGTVGCRSFDLSFYFRIFLFCASLIVSYFIYRKDKNLKSPFLFIPLIFIFNAAFYVVAYRMQWFHIYEQWNGKSWDIRVNEKECKLFFMRLFDNSGLVK